MINLIHSSKDFKDLCARIESEKAVALDTEFIREKTYWPDLCLIQLGTSEGVFLVDPLAKNMDIDPLKSVLTNKNLVKVIHSGRQDFEIFHHLFDLLPENVFDTQIAAMVAGFGDSVGYERLMRELMDVEIDKTSQYTDWARRPLTDAQIAYAASDVEHLLSAHEKLVSILESRGRMSWIETEMNWLIDRKTYAQSDEDLSKKLKLKSRDPKKSEALKRMAVWRDQVAQKANVPRSFILKDHILSEIALAFPKSDEDVLNVRGVPSHFKASYVRDLVAIVNTVRGLSPKDLQKHEHPVQLKEHQEAQLEMLKLLLHGQSKIHGVASKLIATQADLREFVLTGESVFMQGWRFDVFGHVAQDLISGKVGLVYSPSTGDIKLVNHT